MKRKIFILMRTYILIGWTVGGLTACGGSSNDDAEALHATSSEVQVAPLYMPEVGNGAPATVSYSRSDPANHVNVYISSLGGSRIKSSPALKLKNGTALQDIKDLPEAVEEYLRTLPIGHKPLRVEIKQGDYRLANTWIWSANSSGAAGKETLIEGEYGKSVRILGSVLLQQKLITGINSIALPQLNILTDEMSAPHQIWINGKRGILARQPNAGHFYYVNNEVKAINQEEIQKTDGYSLVRFQEDMRAKNWLDQQPQDEIRQANV